MSGTGLVAESRCRRRRRARWACCSSRTCAKSDARRGVSIQTPALSAEDAKRPQSLLAVGCNGPRVSRHLRHWPLACCLEVCYYLVNLLPFICLSELRLLTTSPQTAAAGGGPGRPAALGLRAPVAEPGRAVPSRGASALRLAWAGGGVYTRS